MVTPLRQNENDSNVIDLFSGISQGREVVRVPKGFVSMIGYDGRVDSRVREAANDNIFFLEVGSKYDAVLGDDERIKDISEMPTFKRIFDDQKKMNSHVYLAVSNDIQDEVNFKPREDVLGNQMEPDFPISENFIVNDINRAKRFDEISAANDDSYRLEDVISRPNVIEETGKSLGGGPFAGDGNGRTGFGGDSSGSTEGGKLNNIVPYRENVHRLYANFGGNDVGIVGGGVMGNIHHLTNHNYALNRNGVHNLGSRIAYDVVNRIRDYYRR